jgi:quercetin dioxygenase-like cupin family protein
MEFSTRRTIVSTAAPTAPATGGPLWFFVNLARVRVSPAESGGTLGIVELTGSEGEMPPFHIHHREDETFVMLDGSLSVHTPDGSTTLAPGDAFFAPRGIPHAYRVESERARWLAVSTPAGFADFVLDLATPAPVDDLPPADREVDLGQLAASAERHGIEILGPPGTMPGA